jgi:hypothetical protein
MMKLICRKWKKSIPKTRKKRKRRRIKRRKHRK